MKNSAFLNKEEQNDNIYADVKIVDTAELTGIPPVKNISKCVISNDKVVNFCSPTYALLSNKDFFGKMERELIDEDIDYKIRAFNNDDRSFCVDYVLNDESKKVTIFKNDAKGIDDSIVPMIRLTNSYDGSQKSAGYLGFFRKVCNNGLHMATTQLEFKVKHTRGKMELFVPNIEAIVERFLHNETYSISDKIKKMRDYVIDEKQIYKWIEQLSKEEKVFKFESSDKNPEPGLNARLVHDIVLRDAINTGEEPNAWLVYSGFNELIHGKFNKRFVDQKNLDTRVFNNISNLVGAI